MTEMLTAISPNLGGTWQIYVTKSRFGALDGLRFIAIAAVLFQHAPVRAQLGDGHIIFTRGFLGVDLFFVISGFLITALLLRERYRTGHISLRGFYWRRALRILPLYLVVVTAVGGYYVLLKQEPRAAELLPFYYLFLANFLTSDIPLLGPLWSLAVEEQYYLIWPILLVLLPVRALLPVLYVLISVNVLGIMGVFGIMPPEAGPLRFAFPNATYAPILMGSILAILLHDERSHAALASVLAPRWAAPVLVVALVLLLVMLPSNLIGLPNFAIHLTMSALVGSLVIREDSPLMPILTFRPIVRVGMISYGVYLLHLIALDVSRRLSGMVEATEGGLMHHAGYVALSLILAELSFRYFEKIFLDMRHIFLGRVGGLPPEKWSSLK